MLTAVQVFLKPGGDGFPNMGPELILVVLLSGAAGALLGTFTGLIPGIHVNTLAMILLGSYPFLEETVAGFVDPSWTPLLISCCIMSASAVHSFVDFVPSVFLGVPDADETLSVLPGHRLLEQGKGMAAVRAAAIGSTVGSLSALALAVPIQWVMLLGAADYIDHFTAGVICFTLIVIIMNSSRQAMSLILVIISGMLGLLVQSDLVPVIGLFDGGTMLFPLLTGLFGIPPLLGKGNNRKRKRQKDDGKDPVGPSPGLLGVMAGLIAGWFPGVTSTAGATLMTAFVKERDPARFISLTASIGTVTSVFSVVTLSVSGSGRSGTAMAVKEIIGDSLTGFCSEAFVLLLLSIAVGSAFGYPITVACGKLMCGVSENVPAEVLNNLILIFITILVLVSTGPFGLVVLVISSMLGMVPPALGVSRVCLTGCLMVPVLLNIVL